MLSNHCCVCMWSRGSAHGSMAAVQQQQQHQSLLMLIMLTQACACLITTSCYYTSFPPPCSVFVLHTQSAECPADFLLHSRSSLEGEPWWERAAVARRMSIDSNTCRVCQKPTTTQCGHCKSVKYW